MADAYILNCDNLDRTFHAIGRGFIVFKSEEISNKICFVNKEYLLLNAIFSNGKTGIHFTRNHNVLMLNINGMICRARIYKFLEAYLDEIEYAEVVIMSDDNKVVEFEVAEGELN